MEKGQFDLALEALEYVADLPDVPYLKAICVLLSDRIKNQPVEKYLAFETTKSNDPLYHYWLGKIYLKRLQTAEAKAGFAKFLSPENSRAPEERRREAAMILACLKKPASNYAVVPMESPLNSTFSDLHGILFEEQRELIFASDRGSAGMFSIYRCTKGSYGWDAPEILSAIPPIRKEYLNILRVNDVFFFYDQQHRDLYSVFPGDAWEKRIMFQAKVLSAAHHIYMNKYKNRLIFSAENGTNGLDLFETLKLRTTGEWTAPLSISDELNTPFQEDYPFLSEDRTRLYFCSDRPGGLGKMDIYYSKYNDQNHQWGKAINMGVPINSMDNDLDFYLLSERVGVLSSDRMASRGDLDIFYVTNQD